jgi:hypothetical protein
MVGLLRDKTCSFFSAKRAPYFAWHREKLHLIAANDGDARSDLE